MVCEWPHLVTLCFQLRGDARRAPPSTRGSLPWARKHSEVPWLEEESPPAGSEGRRRGEAGHLVFAPPCPLPKYSPKYFLSEDACIRTLKRLAHSSWRRSTDLLRAAPPLMSPRGASPARCLTSYHTADFPSVRPPGCARSQAAGPAPWPAVDDTKVRPTHEAQRRLKAQGTQVHFHSPSCKAPRSTSEVVFPGAKHTGQKPGRGSLSWHRSGLCAHNPVREHPFQASPSPRGRVS